MAVLLLPTVAEAQAEGNESRIAQAISMSLRYSLYMGILCIGVFTLFGAELGVGVFRDPSAGTFMQILAWLCPFLYLATTLGSILNGLGKTTTTFFQNVTALVLRLAFVLAGIPRFGIMAYLWGMLASELLLAFLHLTSLKRLVSFSWDAIEMIVKPAALLIISVGIYYAVFSFWDGFDSLGLFVSSALHIGVLSLCYGGASGCVSSGQRKITCKTAFSYKHQAGTFLQCVSGLIVFAPVFLKNPCLHNQELPQPYASP